MLSSRDITIGETILWHLHVAQFPGTSGHGTARVPPGGGTTVVQQTLPAPRKAPLVNCDQPTCNWESAGIDVLPVMHRVITTCFSSQTYLLNYVYPVRSLTHSLDDMTRGYLHILFQDSHNGLDLQTNLLFLSHQLNPLHMLPQCKQTATDSMYKQVAIDVLRYPVQTVGVNHGMVILYPPSLLDFCHIYQQRICFWPRGDVSS